MCVVPGSVLVMVGVGNQPYGERVGHHCSQGSGLTTSADRAQGRYDVAVRRLEAGAGLVFAPGQPDRVAQIKVAALGLTGSSTEVPPASTGEDAP